MALTLRTLTRGGEAIDPPEVGLTAALPEAGIEPIELTPERTGPGRYTVDGSSLILAGTWKFTVTVRTTEFDAGVGSMDLHLS